MESVELSDECGRDQDYAIVVAGHEIRPGSVTGFMMPSAKSHRRGLFFWAISPVLLICLVSFPFLIQTRDTEAILLLVAMEAFGVLMLLGLFNPYRFAWTWRGVGLLIFVGCTCYLGQALLQGAPLFAPRGEPNLRQPLLAMLFFGIPGLVYATSSRLVGKWGRIIWQVQRD